VQQRPLTLTGRSGKPPDGPVAWWKLDEAEGASAADASGQGLTARVLGKARWAPGQGRKGGALRLEGPEAGVDCGGINECNFKEALTISLWVKVPEGGKLSPSLVTKGNNTWRLQGAADRQHVSFALTGPLTIARTNPRPPLVKTRRPVNDGQWHHLAAVYDGQRAALYLDGELQDSLAATGLVAVNTEPVMIGQNSMGRMEPFEGWVDDVRLYARGLSEAEIKALLQTEAK